MRNYLNNQLGHLLLHQTQHPIFHSHESFLIAIVVLSACETGQGDITTGEGVYGLRRALVIAGSESQLFSLWRVADEATKDLMINYYKNLQKGEGRTEALRKLQLEMIEKNDKYSHPYYWSSFISSGETKPMNFKKLDNFNFINITISIVILAILLAGIRKLLITKTIKKPVIQVT